MPTTERTYKELTKANELITKSSLNTLTPTAATVRDAIRGLASALYAIAQRLQDECGGPGSSDGVDLALTLVEDILKEFDKANPVSIAGKDGPK